MALTEAEVARYARQLAVPGLGPVAQDLMRDARVHVVGAGSSAGPALLYLAQAGMGTIYVDDGADVAEEDGSSWLYTRQQVGQPRLFAAMEALRAATSFIRARAHASTGARPTATLVCAPTRSDARTAAERARLSGVPHVVALAEGDGGEVVTIPPGAPCYTCASRPGTGMPPRAGEAAAVGVLGALELLLLVSGILKGESAGRRIDLVLGYPHLQPTVRVPGCDCAYTY